MIIRNIILENPSKSKPYSNTTGYNTTTYTNTTTGYNTTTPHEVVLKILLKNDPFLQVMEKLFENFD